VSDLREFLNDAKLLGCPNVVEGGGENLGGGFGFKHFFIFDPIWGNDPI